MIVIYVKDRERGKRGMKISNSMMCPMCGRGFEVILNTWNFDAKALGREGDIEIFETTINPIGEPVYVHNHWNCPKCSFLKGHKNVA